MAVAILWFGESYGEWYSEAVANLKLRHPDCTGLGKWVSDAQRLVDYLYTLPEADRRNIGIMGHSLGSKMAVYVAAFDERITAVGASEGTSSTRPRAGIPSTPRGRSTASTTSRSGYFNHHKGHTPAPEAVWRSMEWLAHFLGRCRGTARSKWGDPMRRCVGGCRRTRAGRHAAAHR